MATIEKSRKDDVAVLKLSGSLDHEGVAEVGEAFSKEAKAGGNVVVDLSEVDVMNTPGIAMILETQRKLKDAGGRLVLAGASGIVDDLFRRCRLDTVLTLAPNMSAAMTQVKQH